MTSLHHIGYWVYDLDAAMKQWSQDLGVGPFHVIEHVTFESFVLTVGERTYDDVVFDHAAAFAAWGPIVVELSQVHAIDDRLAAASTCLRRLRRDRHRTAPLAPPDRGDRFRPAHRRHDPLARVGGAFDAAPRPGRRPTALAGRADPLPRWRERRFRTGGVR